MTGKRAAWWARRGPAGGPPTQPDPVPAVPLSAAGRVRMVGVVAALRAEGVLDGDEPDPPELAPLVADAGEPVTVDTVLSTLFETSDSAQPYRNLAFHNSHCEQTDTALGEQVLDLSRLAGAVLRITLLSARQEFVADGAPRNRTRLRLEIGGTERELDYPGQPKYLSTVLHVTAAKAVEAAGGWRRLAWIWSDQGVWSTALAAGGVERLNTAHGRAIGPAGGWEWVAEQAPVAAGEPLPG